MSLDLLKEKFGSSVSTNKKEVDKKKLNEMFSSNPMGNLESFKAQHQGALEDKNRIIENLELESSDLANQVLTLEKEKTTILEELNNLKWLENTIASKTKKMYEDKIKTMSYVDSSKLIPLLIEVSRKKQGNEKLNWGEWLEIAENKYLFQINELIAKKVFEDTDILIDEAISNINRKRRNYGGDVPTAKNYSLTFTGDTSGTSDHVVTNFNPDTYNLNLGFTVSYWVRADEVGVHMFAFGRKHSNSERFTFGIGRANKIYIGVGPVKMEGTWSGNLDDNPSGQTAAELFPSLFDGGDLKTGNWLHFAVTYADRESTSEGSVARKTYLNGELIQEANLNWSTTGGDTGGMYFGGRNLTTTGYNNGWACGLDEVAIYDTAKDSDWVSSVYNGSTDYNHTGADNLVGYWRFNEGSGTTVEDLSENNNHGTLTAGTGNLPTWSEIEGY